MGIVKKKCFLIILSMPDTASIFSINNQAILYWLLFAGGFSLWGKLFYKSIKRINLFFQKR